MHRTRAERHEHDVTGFPSRSVSANAHIDGLLAMSPPSTRRRSRVPACMKTVHHLESGITPKPPNQSKAGQTPCPTALSHALSMLLASSMPVALENIRLSIYNMCLTPARSECSVVDHEGSGSLVECGGAGYGTCRLDTS